MVHVHVLIFAEDSAVRLVSVIMMSDDLKHDDAYAVYMFTGKLEVHFGEILSPHYPRIGEMIVF